MVLELIPQILLFVFLYRANRLSRIVGRTLSSVLIILVQESIVVSAIILSWVAIFVTCWVWATAIVHLDLPSTGWLWWWAAVFVVILGLEVLTWLQQKLQLPRASLAAAIMPDR